MTRDKKEVLRKKKLEKQKRRHQALVPNFGELSPWQEKAKDLFKDNDLLILSGSPGTGKSHLAAYLAVTSYVEGKYDKIYLIRPAVESGESLGYLPGPQPMNSPILTPEGWTTMGELKIGDKVVTKNGDATEVIGIYPQGTKDVYRIETSDGTSAECCLDHLWKVINKDGSSEVLPLKEIKDNLIDSKGYHKFRLPRNNPIRYTNVDLELSPYTLGALLGDGSFSDTHIRISCKDKQILKRVKEEVNRLGCKLNITKSLTGVYVGTINGKVNSTNRKIKLTSKSKQLIFDNVSEASSFIGISEKQIYKKCLNKSTVESYKFSYEDSEYKYKNPVREVLNNLGLLGKRAWEKSIPECYKYSSIQNRLDLLRGLLDTDGTIKANGEISFSTTSLQLAKDVIEIVRSLGGRSKLRTRNRIGYRNTIKEKNGNDVYSRRVSYEFNINLGSLNPFFLKRKASRFKCKYLPDIYITKVEYIRKDETQCILVNNNSHLYITNDFLVTHNTALEKITPFLIPYFDILEKFGLNPKQFIDQRIIQPVPIAHIKGRTLDDGIIIFDEAEDANQEQLRLVLSRMGPNSKMIITGDPEQTDRRDGKVLDKTFMNFVNRLIIDKPPGIVLVKLTEAQIVRHELVKVLLKYL